MMVMLHMTLQNKQSDQELNLPPICFPKLKFTYFAFKSSEIQYYLKDLNHHGGLNPLNIFPLFFNKITVILVPKLAKNFRRLIAAGSFPILLRQLIYLSPFQFPLDYRLISMTPILLFLRSMKTYFTKDL